MFCVLCLCKCKFSVYVFYLFLRGGVACTVICKAKHVNVAPGPSLRVASGEHRAVAHAGRAQPAPAKVQRRAGSQARLHVQDVHRGAAGNLPAAEHGKAVHGAGGRQIGPRRATRSRIFILIFTSEKKKGSCAASFRMNEHAF
jgi:hypothetical protein